MPPPPARASPPSSAEMTKSMNALLEAQRKCYNDAIARLEDKFLSYIKETEHKFHDVISSLEFSQKHLADLKSQLASAISEGEKKTRQIEQLQRSNQDLKENLQEMSKRTDYMDDQSRRNNLRFTGVTEVPGETWENCQEKLCSILRDQLNLSPKFERVHRIGKPGDKQPRDIVAKFTLFSEREAVMRNRRKMKGTNIFINEDLCPASVEARMQQMPAYHQARKDGKHVYFNYRTLIIRDPTISKQTSTQATSPQSQQTPQSPPPATPSSPRPPTPTSPQPSAPRQAASPAADASPSARTHDDGQRASVRQKKPTTFYRS